MTNWPKIIDQTSFVDVHKYGVSRSIDFFQATFRGGRTNGLTDERMDGRTDGRTDIQTDEQTSTLNYNITQFQHNYNGVKTTAGC